MIFNKCYRWSQKGGIIKFNTDFFGLRKIIFKSKRLTKEKCHGRIKSVDK